DGARGRVRIADTELSRQIGDGVRLLDPTLLQFPGIIQAPVVDPGAHDTGAYRRQRLRHPAAVEDPVARDTRILARVRVVRDQVVVKAMAHLRLWFLIGEAVPIAVE